MSLTRQTQKVFGSNANANQLAVFGTMKTGTPVYSTNLATLQSTAYTQGWSEALLNDKAPYMEEMNAVQYGLSYQIAYMLQEGAFAYDANTTYSSTSIVKAFENGKMYLYHSLVDNNLGHSLDNSTYWEKINISDTRNIGEIVASSIPLTDAGLHLLDGSVLSGSGSYGQFVTYIAGLYTADPTANYFTTEANWQTSVNTYGVCGKFVYDSVNNTVRLPKVTGIIEGTTDLTALGDLVQAGLPNITGLIDGVGRDTGTTASGAFYTRNSTSGACSSTGYNYYGLTFDASRSSSIYGNSSTVQPQTIKVLYYIVVATSTKTNIEVDIDEIATDLNGKADIDLSNINPTQSAIDTIVGWSAPDWANKDDTKTLGTTYAAESNGYVVVSLQATTANSGITCYVNGEVVYSVSVHGQSGATYGEGATIPVAKGDTYKVDGIVSRYFFVPIKGGN